MTTDRMNPPLRYKGYTGSIEASVEDDCLHGRVQHIDDVITYEGQTVAEVKAQFESAVDQYLLHCASIGKAPERQYSGTFNVRVGSDRHRLIVQYGSARGMNVNEVVCLAVDSLNRAATVVNAAVNVKAIQSVRKAFVLMTGANTILASDYTSVGGNISVGIDLGKRTGPISEPEHLQSVGATANYLQ